MLMPILLFIGMWLIQVSIYFFGPVYFLPISSETWTVIFVANTSVIVGYLTVYLLTKNDLFYITTPSFELHFEENQLKKIISLLSLIAFIGAMGQVVLFYNDIVSDGRNPFNIFWYREKYLELGESPGEFSLFYSLFNWFLILNNVGLVLSAIYYTHFNTKLRYALTPLIISIFYSMILLQRSYFVNSLGIWLGVSYLLLFYLQGAKRENAVKLLKKAFINLGIVFFLIIFLVIIIRFNINVGGDGEFSTLVADAYKSILTYIAGTPVALNHYLDREVQLEGGKVLFQNFHKWFARLGLADKSSVVTINMEFVNMGTSYGNVYTYIRILYADFGIYGLVLFTYLWGALGAYTIHRFIKKFSLVLLFFSAIVIFSYFYSFYSFIFQRVTLYLLLFFIIWALEKTLFKSVLITAPKSIKKDSNA